MDKSIEHYLRFGIYRNTLYYPNTFNNTKLYLDFLDPIVNGIAETDDAAIYDAIENIDMNIFATSICTSILGLDKNTYNIISSKIDNNNDLLVFVWIYVILNNSKNNIYLNKLLIEKSLLVKENLGKIFKVYKPPFSVRKKIYKIIKDKYKVRYLIESQEEIETVLEKIKEYNIKPQDIAIEMGFTFDIHIKNSIIKYMLSRYDLVDMIYYIDRWYIDDIPYEIIKEVEDKIKKVSNLKTIYKLLILNTSIDHKALSDIITQYIDNLPIREKGGKLNINYVPNLKSNMKWDGLHAYNSYVASIVSILNEKFDTHINIKDNEVNSNKTTVIYDEVLNNTSFSLTKCNPVVKTSTPTILFSNEIIEGYSILWDVSDEECPLYEWNEHLHIVGKNIEIIVSLIDYLNFFNNGPATKKDGSKLETIKEEFNNEDIKPKLMDEIIDRIEDTVVKTKDKIRNVTISI